MIKCKGHPRKDSPYYLKSFEENMFTQELLFNAEVDITEETYFFEENPL